MLLLPGRREASPSHGRPEADGQASQCHLRQIKTIQQSGRTLLYWSRPKSFKCERSSDQDDPAVRQNFVALPRSFFSVLSKLFNYVMFVTIFNCINCFIKSQRHTLFISPFQTFHFTFSQVSCQNKFKFFASMHAGGLSQVFGFNPNFPNYPNYPNYPNSIFISGCQLTVLVRKVLCRLRIEKR